MIEFLMPSLGADMLDGTLVEWRKKEGDQVKQGDIIAEVETQKGTIEIEIFNDGIIDKLLVEPGTKVPVGKALALIKQTIGNAVMPSEPKGSEESVHPILEIEKTPVVTRDNMDKRIKISPLAKRIAMENNIDITTLSGSGENGAITKEDVENAMALGQQGIAKQMPVASITEKSKSSNDPIRAAVAAAMSRSNREIPHYYLEKKINMSKALDWMHETNKQRSVKERILPAALLIKSTALSLRHVPELNAVWDNTLLLKEKINIGFVVSLRSGGIIVPAIHQADQKSVSEIMQSLNDVIPRARELRLKSSELSDSTLTITSLGEGGADVVYGIIYPPQVAIVGFGSITEQPFAENGMLGVRHVMHVTLAGDHRATDGLTGSKFLTLLDQYLQNPETL